MTRIFMKAFGIISDVLKRLKLSAGLTIFQKI